MSKNLSMTGQETFKELYEKYNSSHYKHLIVDSAFRESYWEHRLKPLGAIDPSSKVMDVGCGNSDLLLYLKSKGLKNLAGVDISHEMIDVARSLMPEATLLLADAVEHFESHTSSYDLIFANHLMEHLPKEKVIDLFKAIAGALRQGGTFFLLTPNFASPFGMQMAFGDFTHITPFSATSLAQLAELSGLNFVHSQGNGPVPYKLSGKVKHVLWKAILEPLGKVAFGMGGNQYGKVVGPELCGIFRKP